MSKAAGKHVEPVVVYLEVGRKRVFAGAVDWPGWCISGKDAGAALQALFEAGPKYAKVLRNHLEFQSPTDIGAFKVIEQIEGNSTTDFGAPDAAPSSDKWPVEQTELRRLEAVLEAGWDALDAAAEAAAGKPLRKGPRGGGRDLEGIIAHVLAAEAGYLSALGWKFAKGGKADRAVETRRTRAAVLDGLAASVAGEIPATRPRGGQRWLPRFFVRRTAWHAIDHAWEIEKRVSQDDGS